MFKSTLTICVALLAVLAVADDVDELAVFDGAENSARILGAVSSRRNEFPHLCAIEVIRTIGSTEVIGAGSILGRRWILTTASNVVPNNINRRTEVLCGRFDLGLSSEVTEQRMRVARSTVHSSFRASARASAFDIALLQLTAELHYTPSVQAITLPAAGTTPTGIATLIGWGGTDDVWIGQRLQRLQMTRVAIVPAVQCLGQVASFNLTSNTTHFCTGPATGGLSPCNEDRGSSLLQQTAAGLRVLIGLVSLPQGCGQPLWHGTYTRVSEFVPWINQVMQL